MFSEAGDVTLGGRGLRGPTVPHTRRATVIAVLVLVLASLVFAAKAGADVRVSYRDPAGGASDTRDGTVDIENSGSNSTQIEATIYAGDAFTVGGLTCVPGSQECDDFDISGGGAGTGCIVYLNHVVCPDAANLVANLGPADDSIKFPDARLGFIDATIHGGPGNDTVEAPLGFGDPPTARLFGDAGSDRLDGSSGPAQLRGGDGNDFLYGGAASDTILGEGSNDTLFGGPGNDYEDGGEGDDILNRDFIGFNQDGGPDVYVGGPGQDSIEYLESGAISVSIDGQSNDGMSAEGDNVGSDIEKLGGTSSADTLSGGPGAETIDGGAGGDTINGGGGNDTLRGSLGDDKVTGGAGLDSLYGDDSDCTLLFGCSAGNDILSTDDGEIDSANCGPGADQITADQGDAVASDPINGCEQVTRIAPPPPPPGITMRVKKLKGGVRGFLRKGLTITVTCAAACTLSARASISARIARKLRIRVTPRKAKNVLIARRNARLGRAGTATLRLKPKAGKAQRRLKHLIRLKRLQRLKLTVAVSARDASGARTSISKRVTVK